MSVVCRNVFWLNGKGALLHRVVPPMLADHMSVSTSQWSEERSMVIHLILTTLARPCLGVLASRRCSVSASRQGCRLPNQGSGRSCSQPCCYYGLFASKTRTYRAMWNGLIVDNRGPTEVEHWPAFARWWSSRRGLVGPQNEKTDVPWTQANQACGLHDVPYCWAGVFVLEAARFLYPSVLWP